MGDLGSIPWLGRSPGEGNGYPVQYSDLENSMDSKELDMTVTLTFTSCLTALGLVTKILNV